MKKKILFVYDSMMTGGTSTALLSLFNSIDFEKYEINLLLYTNTGDLINEVPDFVNILQPAYKGSRFLTSGQQKIIRTVLNGGLFKAIKAFIKYKNTPKGNFRHILMHYGMAAQVALSRKVSEHYDYAIGFMEGWSNEYVASPKINAKKKFVWVHPQYKSCYLIPEIDKKTFKRVDGIALVSNNCLQQFFEFFPEFKQKTKVVPNILSSELVLTKAQAKDEPVNKGAFNFCTICRCDVKVKGLDRLLKVFYELKKQGLTNGVKWHLIGGGGDFDKFSQQIKDLELDDTIILYGNKLNPLPYLRYMDVFVLTSRYEGKPVSVTEAQILGLPCIVTNYESAVTQVDHQLTGFIADNDYQSIYDAIKMVIDSPSIVSEWRKNTISRSYGNEHDIEEFYKFILR